MTNSQRPLTTFDVLRAYFPQIATLGAALGINGYLFGGSVLSLLSQIVGQMPKTASSGVVFASYALLNGMTVFAMAAAWFVRPPSKESSLAGRTFLLGFAGVAMGSALPMLLVAVARLFSGL